MYRGTLCKKSVFWEISVGKSVTGEFIGEELKVRSVWRRSAWEKCSWKDMWECRVWVGEEKCVVLECVGRSTLERAWEVRVCGVCEVEVFRSA